METAKLTTAVNNLITRAHLAMYEGDYKAASNYFRIVATITDAIEAGEDDNSLHGRYLIEYAAGKHR